jgi:hypothetical protein
MLKPSITTLSTRVLGVAVRPRVSRLYLALTVSLLLITVAGDALATKGFCVNGIFFPNVKLPKAGKCKLVTGGYALFASAYGSASGTVCTDARDGVSTFDLTLVVTALEAPQSNTVFSEQIFVRKDTLTSLVMFENALDGSRGNFTTSATLCEQ